MITPSEIRKHKAKITSGTKSSVRVLSLVVRPEILPFKQTAKNDLRIFDWFAR